jgi:hypothetical protein
MLTYVLHVVGCTYVVRCEKAHVGSYRAITSTAKVQACMLLYTPPPIPTEWLNLDGEGLSGAATLVLLIL